MIDDLTPAMLRAICAISRTPREDGVLPAVDLGPGRSTVVRALQRKGILASVCADSRGTPSSAYYLTDHGLTIAPAALAWEKSHSYLPK